MGNKIDDGDIYVSAGDIMTSKSLLVKQGYFEFKAALPSDGHAFMSWWLMGTPTGGNNNAFADSLYGKVYKLNPNYNGKNAFDPTTFTESYKYQLPNTYFEIDIIELMQDITMFQGLTTAAKRKLTGIYDYNLTSNIHKYYDTYATGSECYVVDWETGAKQKYSLSAIDSTDEPDWIASARASDYIFGSTKQNASRPYDANRQKMLTQMRRYGFEWTVTENKYDFTLYIFDPDGDGQNTDQYTKITLNNIDYNEGTGPISDLDTANQYMFFIIDNVFYTSNHLNDNQANFTDLLSMDNADKTTLEIEYMRVYQADGKRDIVTPETEAFNNGNHFGY